VTSYKVNEAATVLGVSAPTVRRWSKFFGSQLSGSATPGPGVERLFDDDDLRVLAYVRDRSAVGHTGEAILAELPAATLPDLASILGGDRSLTPGDSLPALPDSPLTAFLGRIDSHTGETAKAQASIADSLDRLTTAVDLAQEVAGLKVEVAELRRLVEVLTQEVADLRRRRGIFF
jgi:DNA-binding transcriptional MerR regulator